MGLRDYQLKAVESALHEFERVSSTLIVSPTGSGKNRIAAEVIRRMGGNSIFIAHREELLFQAKETIEKHAGLQCELELGDKHASEAFPADVLLASVQTMIAGRNGQRRMHKFSPFNYNLVVVDEVHHSTAASYRAVLEHFKNNGALKILGITATPERSDNEALGQIFESVAFDYPVLTAINDGWLVPIQQQLIDIQGLDFSHVRTTAGDLNAGDLAAVMEAERNLYGVCDATMRELGDKKAIMFCVSVKQAETACSILNRYRAGISSWASGKTPRDERRAIMKAFSEGSYQVLVNCALVDEGFDIPDASLLVDAYPTKSKLRYQQRLGRIMRPLPGIVDSVHENTLRRQAIANSSKPLATVMDFTGNAGRHKLVHAVDILGGKISERTRELIERKLRQSGRPEKIDQLVLEAERKEEEERRRAEAARKARLTGKARYTMRMINPFDAFDLLAPPQRNWERNKQLSEKQRILLRKQGIDPDGMPYNEAKTLINELFRRWKLGLCTLRQAAVLKRSGYDTRQISRERASQLITELKANQWQR